MWKASMSFCDYLQLLHTKFDSAKWLMFLTFPLFLRHQKTCRKLTYKGHNPSQMWTHSECWCFFIRTCKSAILGSMSGVHSCERTGFCCGKRCHIHWDMIQIDTSTAKIINNQKSSAMGKKSNNACSGCHAPKTPTTRRGSEITRNCARFSRKNKNQMGRSLRTPVRKWWITHICLYHDKNTYIIDLNVNMYLYI